uniref:Ubiquitin-like-conjugating enzyme ATG3 n=1 Tax=Romanomermis culicivorax TaxID=13658 RepID=A0A915KKB6_ROMCU
MDDLINTVKSQALNVAEYFTPVLKESKFKEQGILTPEEFVLAGDHLVLHCPTWSWYSGDESRTKPYLPKEKQMLITKNVPCYRRFKQIDNVISHEKVLDGDDVDSGWVDTHFYAPENSEKVKDMGPEQEKKLNESADDNEIEEAVDMEAFMEQNIIDDDPNLAPLSHPIVVESAQDEILKTRTYDLNITYDNYYRTPRMWLSGYDEHRRPLTVEQMYDDFSSDHTKKTITMENHPHLRCPPMASIHPCRHADVMKRIIDELADNGRELGVHQYLIVFLKFLQAVIPTIEYDYTKNVSL